MPQRPTTSPTVPAWLLAIAAAWAWSCVDHDHMQPEDSGPGDADADEAEVIDPGPRCLVAIPVDLLFVVDNSNSMQEEQENLAQNFPVLIEVLTAPADVDGDGSDDFPPVDDLRVGVVTTDMGVDTEGVLGCTAVGDEAVLVSSSRSEVEACAGVTVGPQPWISFGPESGATTEQVAEQFACLARLGTTGCGYEQHLSASLAALTTRAAGGEPNEGFLRDDSLVVVVFVTDEDDCSASDPELFDPTPLAMDTLGTPGTRCALNPDRLLPVSHYVTALDALRLDRPAGVMVAAIAGIPLDAVADSATVDYDALLADERMLPRVDPDDPFALVPVCTGTSVGSAAPARRLVEFVRDFAPGERGVVSSICSTDLRPAMEAIARLVARRLCDRPY